MAESVCSDCKHFHRHYTRYRRGDYIPTAFGHCCRPRVKIRREDAPKNKKFLPRPADT